MDITVAICTWNRADLLDQTLAEMRKLRIPDGVAWELLVVNNNCTDHTDQVIDRHLNDLPLRRLFEAKQGHSHARNCAIDAACGELLVWTDDDVLVHEDWLEEYANAWAAFPEAGFFGGPIDPWFESEPPSWMMRHWKEVHGIFVIRDYGPEVRAILEEETPAGANMAFPTHIMKERCFDVRLGRFGATLTGGDDSMYIEELRRRNYQGVWVGTARVRHFLPRQRLTRRFVADWYKGAGRTQYRLNGGCEDARLLGLPRWAIAKYLQAAATSWCLSPWKDDRWFSSFRQAANLQGFLAESRGCQTPRLHRASSVIDGEHRGDLTP